MNTLQNVAKNVTCSFLDAWTKNNVKTTLYIEEVFADLRPTQLKQTFKSKQYPKHPCIEANKKTPTHMLSAIQKNMKQH